MGVRIYPETESNKELAEIASAYSGMAITERDVEIAQNYYDLEKQFQVVAAEIYPGEDTGYLWYCFVKQNFPEVHEVNNLMLYGFGKFEKNLGYSGSMEGHEEDVKEFFMGIGRKDLVDKNIHKLLGFKGVSWS